MTHCYDDLQVSAQASLLVHEYFLRTRFAKAIQQRVLVTVEKAGVKEDQVSEFSFSPHARSSILRKLTEISLNKLELIPEKPANNPEKATCYQAILPQKDVEELFSGIIQWLQLSDDSAQVRQLSSLFYQPLAVPE